MGQTKLAVGVSVHVYRGSKILLGRRNKALAAGGLLSTPGGRVEENETITHAAVREVMEETGLPVHECRAEVFAVRQKFAYGGMYIMFYVRIEWCESCGEEPRTMEPDKCDGWFWYDTHAVDKNDTTEPEDVLLASVWDTRDELPFFGIVDERD